MIVKNEGASLRHGTWKYYDPETGDLARTESYTLGELDKNKTTTGHLPPKRGDQVEVLDFEKKNAGKKKVGVRDGSTGN